MVDSKKQMFYTRSGGRTVAVYAMNRAEAREKFKAMNFEIESAIVSLDEWLNH